MPSFTRPSALRVSLFLTASLALLVPYSVDAQSPMRFTCGKAGVAEKSLVAATRFDNPGAGRDSAFGFDLTGSPTTFAKSSCSSEKPFFFSVAVPDGSYKVTLLLGSNERSIMTVRAESRRLFVDRTVLAKDASFPVEFNVNVRTDAIAGAPGPVARVKLKPREIGALDWDDKLTLEFNGEHPGFRSISIVPLDHVPTLYLAGDSTVVDQDKEPWAAWGQMLPAFFGPGLVVANEAESGETIRSFAGERRLDKILSTIKPGDTLMIQFGHNDQKAGTPEATDFRGYLQRYLTDAQEHGASVILVTSMNRRVFDTSGKIEDTLLGYPQAMRTFAAENHVPLIDLNAMSKTLFEAMGPEGTLKAFVHYPANTFPGQDAPLADDTHFNAYGAYELARAVVQSMNDQRLPLATLLRPGIPPFDPASPDPVSSEVFPQSPLISVEKPYGK